MAEQKTEVFEDFAFRLRKGSEMYACYMDEWHEKQKLHDLSKHFFNKHNFSGDKYIMGSRLIIELSDDEFAKYSSQIMKDTIQGCCQFKKNSKMQKLYEEEVTSHCDIKKIRKNALWYWPFMERGTYAMWNDGEDVYGYLSNCHTPSDDMIRIKMSEYYKAQEDFSEKHKK